MVDEMNEMDSLLKEIKMKHDQWNVDWRKWDETWTMKCGMKEIRSNINNEIDNVTTNVIFPMLCLQVHTPSM